MFKKCRVILLPTKEKAENCILISDKTRRAVYHGKQYFTQEYLKETWWTAHHMYIVSDDEPKYGDKVIATYEAGGRNHVEIWEYTKAPCPMPYWGNPNSCKKIIATSELRLAYVPYVSVGFIEKFVEESNKGNILGEVMVEYNTYNRSTTWEHDEPEITELKVDPKDNTITIRKIKTEWSRTEVEDLIYKAMKTVGYTSVDDFQHFCKENL